MPTQALFSKIQPFPADAAQADLPTVSLLQLEERTESESKRLYAACCQYGFFKLDLRGSATGESMMKEAENMFEANAETFDLDRSVLDSFAYKPPKDLSGYKAAGLLKAENGKVDSTHLFTVNQDDILDPTASKEFPVPIDARREQFHAFFNTAGKCVATIMNNLDNALGIPAGTLASRCALEKPSLTSLRLVFSEASDKSEDDERVTLPGHTDIGLITLLFNVVGGLQILPSDAENASENWRFIRPEAGCAVVNLGDTIVEWTGGLLRSSLHRVAAPPGLQAASARRSLAYLVRPARDTTMARLHGDGSIVPSLAAGEQADNRSTSEWAAERAAQIIRGELRPRTIGGLGA